MLSPPPRTCDSKTYRLNYLKLPTLPLSQENYTSKYHSTNSPSILTDCSFYESPFFAKSTRSVGMRSRRGSYRIQVSSSDISHPVRSLHATTENHLSLREAERQSNPLPNENHYKLQEIKNKLVCSIDFQSACSVNLRLAISCSDHFQSSHFLSPISSDLSRNSALSTSSMSKESKVPSIHALAKSYFTNTTAVYTRVSAVNTKDFIHFRSFLVGEDSFMSLRETKRGSNLTKHVKIKKSADIKYRSQKWVIKI
jgi:hypothetical protein